MPPVTLTTSLLVALHALVIAGYGLRVISRRRPVGVSLAWLVVIVVVPYLGAVVYQLFGERRLGERRVQRMRWLLPRYLRQIETLQPAAAIDWQRHGEPCQALHDLAVATVGPPGLAGNRMRLCDDSVTALRELARDVERARRSVHLEFYIWHPGGAADDVCTALRAAAQRGVPCRVLLDALGSAAFLASQACSELRAAGVRVVAALPVRPWRALFVRADHRLHRKLAVLDGEVAYTGSQNLVDPRHFKTDGPTGPWVDVMARVEGPIVAALGAVFEADWELETGEHLAAVSAAPVAVAAVDAQVVPSGPGFAEDAIHQMLLMAIYSARRRLVLTTPYFVPDDSLLLALRSAALRGVRVTVIVPARVDSLLVRLASRANFAELLRSGVELALFRDGLLHSKTITIDDEVAVLGSVNLDMRSMWLNFELSLFVYDRDFTARLRDLQQRYLARSDLLELAQWRKRPWLARLCENTALLCGPLL